MVSNFILSLLYWFSVILDLLLKSPKIPTLLNSMANSVLILLEALAEFIKLIIVSSLENIPPPFVFLHGPLLLSLVTPNLSAS